MEQLSLVIYDIEDDRIRTRIAEDCKDKGLERIQMSTFRGELSRTLREELFALLVSRLGKGRGRILVVAICEKDVRAIRECCNAGETASPKGPAAEHGAAAEAGGAP